jgi:hypothetical protein
MMSMRLVVTLILCLLAGAMPALAHSPIMGIGGVPGGALHAVLIPEHGMGLLALGLVLGRQPWPERRTGMLIFIITLICGLVAASFAFGEALAADVLLTATGILGLLIAAAWAPRFIGWIVAAIIGLTLGLDSRPEVATTEEMVRMLIGSAIGAIVVPVLVSEVAFRLRGAAQLMVSRVMGSWIAAIAILVLSLRIVTQMTVG